MTKFLLIVHLVFGGVILEVPKAFDTKEACEEMKKVFDRRDESYRIVVDCEPIKIQQES